MIKSTKLDGGVRRRQVEIFETHTHVRLTPAVSCGTGWRGPCAVCTGRDRPDRQLDGLVSRRKDILVHLGSQCRRTSMFPLKKRSLKRNAQPPADKGDCG